jgi:hypothetical protein
MLLLPVGSSIGHIERRANRQPNYGSFLLCVTSGKHTVIARKLQII